MKGSGTQLLSLLVAIVIFISAIFVYSTFVVPEYERVNLLRAEVEAKQQTLDEQRTIVEKVSSLLTRYQSIPKLGEVISVALPADEDVASAFQQIYTIAAASGITIQQFSANTGLSLGSDDPDNVAVRSVGTAQLNLYLVGSYENFKAFIETVERNMRIMDVVDLKIQSAGRSAPNSLLFNLTINTYYQS